MIFAHAPLGYLTAYATRRWWNQPLRTRSQRVLIYAIATVGGMFPDIDLVYFYFFNASLSHRQLLTHSLLPYAIIMLLGFILVQLRFQRWRWLGRLLIAFTLGVYSHFLADAWVGRLIVFYPFSTELFGLSSWSWYANSIFLRYSLTTNYTAELLLFIVAGYTLVKKKLWYIVTAIILIVGGVLGLVWLDQHTYKTNGVFAYDDTDGDGLINAQDIDLDGDNIVNVDDSDADNDGVSNLMELDQQHKVALGSYYDFTKGAFIQIPLRIGLVNDHVLIERLYMNVGIPLPAALVADYEINPTGYTSTPKDYQFVGNVQNWTTWFQHHNQWLSPQLITQAQPYDVIFFQSGHVALFYPELDQASVIEVSAQQPFTSIVPLQEVVAREGEVVGIGRILP